MFGFAVNGRLLTYYLMFVACAALILALLRVVNSPFGRVLQAIRENDFRAEALGFRTVFHLTYANCVARAGRARAGIAECAVAALCRPGHLARALRSCWTSC